MSPKIVDKHQRKLDIIQASLALFERNAIAKTTIAMIAKEANLSKGSFYELFENKTSLIIFIVNSMFVEMNQGFDAILKANIKASEKITHFFISSIEATLKGSVISDVSFELWRLAYIEKEPAAIATMEAFFELYINMLVTVLQEGVKTKEFCPHDTLQSARAIGAMIDGLQLQAVVKGFDLIPTAEHAIQYYIKGLQSC